MTASRGTLLARGLLLVGSSIFALVLAEVILRFLGFADVVQFDYVQDLGWVHVPSQETRTVGGWPVHINSAGFRGPEVSKDKSDGTIRILLIGDSFTFGYGVPDDSTLAQQLQRDLKAVPGCPRVQVLNGGVNGYDTQQEALFLNRFGLQYHPDIVILGFIPNDILSPEESRTLLDRPRLKRLLSRSALYQLLAPRLKGVLFRKQGAAYSQAINDFIAGDSAVDWRIDRVRKTLIAISDTGREAGYRTVIAVFPFMEQVHNTAGGSWPPDALLKLDELPGISVFDALPGLRAAALTRGPLFLDEPTHHPNPTALGVISWGLARFLGQRGLIHACEPGARAP